METTSCHRSSFLLLAPEHDFLQPPFLKYIAQLLSHVRFFATPWRLEPDSPRFRSQLLCPWALWTWTRDLTSLTPACTLSWRSNPLPLYSFKNILLLLFSCWVVSTLCHPMDWSTPGLYVIHFFLYFWLCRVLLRSFFSSCNKGGLSLVAVRGLLVAGASLVVGHWP